MMFKPSRKHEHITDDIWKVTVTPPKISGFKGSSSVYLSDRQYRAYLRWLDGHWQIQEALPELTASEREILMSGISPQEWDKFTKGEE